MKIIDREVCISCIPQDVQSAIDTILSWGYAEHLENQILRQRLKEVQAFVSESEVDAAVEATHKNTKAATAERVRVMITRSGQESDMRDED
jgi:hypothetical protein